MIDDLLAAPGPARLDEDAGPRSLSLARPGAVNLPWLGINAVSGALISLVLPRQVEDLRRRSGAPPAAVDAAKGTALAWLLGGVVMAAVLGAFVWGGQVALPRPLQPPMLNTLLVLAVLLGLGYRAYQAADWVLATAGLPDPARAGRILGGWHLALAGPQALAGAVGGALLASTAAWGWTPFNRYALLFGVAASLLILGSLLIRRVPGIR